MLLGFQTGAFHKFIQPISMGAINLCKNIGCNAIELGCGRPERIKFLKNIAKEDLKFFKHISLHAPAIKYNNSRESRLILKAIQEANDKFNFNCVVIHPDLVADWNIFCDYSFKIAIENMDQEKLFGKTVNDLATIFKNNNKYKMVLDINHCYTNDRKMKLVNEFYVNFKEQISEIHLSGYRNKKDNHVLLFMTKQSIILDAVVNRNIPLIIESICLNANNARQEYNYIKKYLFG